MRVSSVFLTSRSNERTLSFKVALAGITLLAMSALSAPTVTTASVHHADFAAAVSKRVGLDNGQRVHVGANTDAALASATCDGIGRGFASAGAASTRAHP